MPTRIALTLGDPRGIGPEVMSLAAARFREERPEARILFVGPEGMAPAEGEYLSVGPWNGGETEAGSVAGRAVVEAARLAREGRVQGVVTGPVHKPALRRAGWTVPGQTEMLQELTGAPEVGMLMAAAETSSGGALRILLATTHLPLREVPHRVTSSLLIRQTLLLKGALEQGWRISAPRIALCALNPHASDGGLFGSEESDTFLPAVEELRSRGVDAEGPVAADTVFLRALNGEFHGVVAPYHDVGMAAFKSTSFGRGVNVTLGLPFIRTSPDHGTAFDLVGTGEADESSALEALRLAFRLRANRFDTPAPRI